MVLASARAAAQRDATARLLRPGGQAANARIHVMGAAQLPCRRRVGAVREPYHGMIWFR